MSDVEIVLYVWGLSNVFWILMNCFVVDVRIEPSEDTSVFLIAVLLSPLAAVLILFQFIDEKFDIDVFKEI